MSDGSDIEWCDATWPPVVGCSRVDHRCDNCYAIGTVHRFRKADGLTKLRPKDASRPGLDWSGSVALQHFHLADPLHWRKPRRIFVCSQADLFHPAVPFAYIAAVFGVTAACPQHTMLVLTKRITRAIAFFAWYAAEYGDRSEGARVEANRAGLPLGFDDRAVSTWPLPNVHLGVSVSDQPTADADIPELLRCPAAVHWVSYEPALGPVDFRPWLPERATMAFVGPEMRAATGLTEGDTVALSRGAKLSWIVVGGESGPRARPFDIAWADSTVAQCRRAGVAPFVKQLGSVVTCHADVFNEDGRLAVRGTTDRIRLASYAGGDMDEWRSLGLERLCVREVV